MVTATEEFAIATACGGRSGAMAADVEEAAEFPVGAADNKKRFADQFSGEEVAGIFDLIDVADDLPGFGEDVFLLGGGDHGIGVEMCGEGPGASDIRIYRQRIQKVSHRSESGHCKL
jgi:hypothetical protein